MEMRRKFSREFKLEAVRWVTERGVAVTRACRDLDVVESVLRRWMRELADAPSSAFPGHGQQRGLAGRDCSSEEGGCPSPGGA